MGTTTRVLATLSLGIATTLLGLPGRAQDKEAIGVPYAKDGEKAVPKRFDKLHGVRYMEFYLIGNTPVDGHIKGTCYNTSALEWPPGTTDTCPPNLVAKLNAKELAKEYKVPKVWLNPPRQWILDWLEVACGRVREFGGIKAAWCATLNVPKTLLEGKRPSPYQPMTIARKSKFGFNKGTKVHLLDDPEGNTWIQKSLTQSVSKENTLEHFDTIGTRLKLPNGWKSRMKVLDQDLILIPATGIARILGDDLFDMYDVTGKGYSNYKP